MHKQNAARLYKAVQKAAANKERKAALNDPEAFVKLAAARGISLTVEKLATQISRLSDEDVAAIFNPGIPPRQHLIPR